MYLHVSGLFLCQTLSLSLTLLLGLTLQFQVHGGQTKFLTLLGKFQFLSVIHTKTLAHCRHLIIKLLSCNLMVKSQPTELDLDTK